MEFYTDVEQFSLYNIWKCSAKKMIWFCTTNLNHFYQITLSDFQNLLTVALPVYDVKQVVSAMTILTTSHESKGPLRIADKISRANPPRVL